MSKAEIDRIKILKPSDRERALRLLAECKKREKKMKLVTVRRDKITVVLMSRTKAKKLGLYGNKTNKNL